MNGSVFTMRRVVCLAAVVLALPPVASARQARAPAEVATAIDRLAHDDIKVRWMAERRLQKFGEKARPALVVASIRHPDLEVRMLARRVLDRIHERWVRRVIEELGDKNPVVREAAEKDLLADLRSDQNRIAAAKVGLVCAARAHPDPTVRAAADRVLKQTYAARVRELIPLLGDEEFLTRHRAMCELLRIGAPALGQLRKATRDGDLEVRCRAGRLIETITRPQQ